MARGGDGGIGTLVTLGAVGFIGYLFWPQISSFLGIGTTAAAAPAGGTPAPPATTGTGTPPAAPPPPPAFSQLDAVYTQLIQAAVADYQAGDRSNQLSLVNGAPQTTFNAWNYFLAKVAPNVGSLPDYQTAAGQADLGVPMSGPQYWSVMAPWLKTNKGFSGIGVFGGLAGLAFRGRRR